MPSHRAVFTLVGLAGLACLTSCKEEDTRLFDEAGVWSLEKFSIGGTQPYADIDQSRKNRFLLRFKPDDGVVAAANCHAEGDTASVEASTCFNASTATWDCRCFAYTYDNDRMVWQEFGLGESPPPVGNPAGEDSGAVEVIVEPYGDASSTYTFGTFPMGLFDSDGEVSKHVMQIRADSVWTDADVNEDGTPDLEFCSQGCFPSEGGGG